MVEPPQIKSASRNQARLLELSKQECGDQFAREKARSDVDPGVLVHLTAKELLSVGPFLPDDICALEESRVVDQKSPALAGNHVLGFVEAHGREMADAAQRSTFVASQCSLSRILDDYELVTLSNGHDGVHLAADSGVMHRHNRLRSRRYRRLNLGFVDIERVGTNIDKNRHTSSQHDGVGRRYKGERWHYYFVAGAYVGEDGSHLQRGGTRLRE